MSEIMVCFSCCVTRQPPRKKPRIDRTMIGLPTNFVHTGHVGSGDVNSNTAYVNSLQGQMQSKGGYSRVVSPVKVQLKMIDIQIDDS